ncbi:hypothetical protein BGZ54_001241 [Gamsiella multidivaricata]|nr:hypothetical protein BGZ54_001241 [Gamsiella multidivaricata]
MPAPLITLPMAAPPNVDPIVASDRVEQPLDVATSKVIKADATSSPSVEPVAPASILKQPMEDFYQTPDAATKKRRRATVTDLVEEMMEQIKAVRRMEGNPDGAKLAFRIARLAGNELEDMHRTWEMEAYYEAYKNFLEQRPPRLPYRDR